MSTRLTLPLAENGKFEMVNGERGKRVIFVIFGLDPEIVPNIGMDSRIKCENDG